MAEMTFAADPSLGDRIPGLAEEFVEMARRNYRIALDYSDASIQQVETIADHMFRTKPKAPPDPVEFGRQLLAAGNDIGAYIGETYRRNHGGEWGMVTDEDGSWLPGIRSLSGSLFWPTGRARMRLESGAENNLWHYYLMLTQPSR